MVNWKAGRTPSRMPNIRRLDCRQLPSLAGVAKNLGSPHLSAEMAATLFSEMNSKVLIAVVIGAATAALAATLVLMAFGTDSAGAIGGGVGGAVGAAVGAQMAGKSKKDE